jgi:hypothetical protein
MPFRESTGNLIRDSQGPHRFLGMVAGSPRRELGKLAGRSVGRWGVVIGGVAGTRTIFVGAARHHLTNCFS